MFMLKKVHEITSTTNLSFYLSSVLWQQLRNLLCARCHAFKTNKNPTPVAKLIPCALLRMCFLILPVSLAASEKGPDLGKVASPELIKQWNMDIFPNGKGLPKGQGTVAAGNKVYDKYCLSCHGVDGTGDSADELAGAMHTLTEHPPDKTIGTYWPFATTVFDFTQRSMPLNAPGILNNNELYSVTAYLLYLNEIIDEDKIINANTLAEIKMPNRKGFINIYKQEKLSND